MMRCDAMMPCCDDDVSGDDDDPVMMMMKMTMKAHGDECNCDRNVDDMH